MSKYIISEINEKAIKKYINNMIANGNDNANTVESHEKCIKRALSQCKKDYNNLSIDDIDKIFSSIKNTGTRELTKTKFRLFLRYYKLNNLANHIHINSKYFKTTNKTDNDILTEEEINKIRNSELSIRDKSICELFLTTGIRRGEFINLKVQNVQILKDRIKINGIKGKTGERNISIIPYPNNPIAFYPTNFVAYLQNHIFKDKKNKPLFFSESSNTLHKPLNPMSLTLFFRKVAKYADIDKKITPHILRHTSATHDGYHLTEQELRLKYGWSTSSDMPNRYCHLNEINFDENLKRKAGLTPDIIKKEAECPYCHTENNINAIECKNCHRIINKEEMAKRAEEQEKREKAIIEEITELKKEIKEMEKFKKEIFEKLNVMESKTKIEKIDELDEEGKGKIEEIKVDTIEQNNKIKLMKINGKYVPYKPKIGKIWEKFEKEWAEAHNKFKPIVTKEERENYEEMYRHYEYYLDYVKGEDTIKDFKNYLKKIGQLDKFPFLKKW